MSDDKNPLDDPEEDATSSDKGGDGLTKADEQSEGDEKLYAGKFKSVEELEKSAVEGQSHIERIESENRVLREQDALRNQAAQNIDGKRQDIETQKILNDNFDTDQQGAVRAMIDLELRDVKKELQQQKAIAVQAQIKAEHPNYMEMAPEVEQIMVDNPGTNPLVAFRAVKSVMGDPSNPELSQAQEKIKELESKLGFVDGGGGTPRSAELTDDEARLDRIMGKV